MTNTHSNTLPLTKENLEAVQDIMQNPDRVAQYVNEMREGRNKAKARAGLLNIARYLATKNPQFADFYEAAVDSQSLPLIQGLIDGTHRLEETEILERAVTQRDKNTGMRFFLHEYTQQPNVKNIAGTQVPFTFMPRRISLRMYRFTPTQAVPNLDALAKDSATLLDIIKQARYTLIDLPEVLNSFANLKIGDFEYLKEKSLRRIGDDHFTDRTLGTINIDRKNIAKENSNILFNIDNNNIIYTRNCIIEAVIEVVAIVK